MTSIDAYAFWRSALKPGAHPAPFLATLYAGGSEDPQPGLYRMRKGLNRNGGVLVPVKIWVVDDEGNTIHKIAPDQSFIREGYPGGQLAIAGEIDGTSATARRLADIWLSCQPVTKAAMDHYVQEGHWPDEAPRLSNQAPTDPLECLVSYMETAAAWIAKTAINTRDLASLAANYTAELAKLAKAADDDRDAKVRPHLEAQRDINGTYKPALDDAKTLIASIKRASEGFLKAERDRIAAEQAAKYEAERKAHEAEVARLAAERATLERDDPIAAYTSPEPEIPPPPAPPEEAKILVGGARGRRMGLRTVTEYHVTDYDALLAHVARNPKVVEVVEAVGKQLAKAGVAVPGVTAREVEKVQ
jgi:hypothetical protein